MKKLAPPLPLWAPDIKAPAAERIAIASAAPPVMNARGRRFLSEIIVTHGPDSAARGARVAKKLGALGFKVRNELDIDGALSPHARRRRAAEIDKAAYLLVLWSKDAAAAPALLDAAARAQAVGKLKLARLDAAVPPAALRRAAAADLSGWSGRDTRAWRALVAGLGAKPAAAAPRRATASAATSAAPAPAAKKGGAFGWVLLLLVIAAIGAGGFYAYSQGLIPGL